MIPISVSNQILEKNWKNLSKINFQNLCGLLSTAEATRVRDQIPDLLTLLWDDHRRGNHSCLRTAGHLSRIYTSGFSDAFLSFCFTELLHFKIII